MERFIARVAESLPQAVNESAVRVSSPFGRFLEKLVLAEHEDVFFWSILNFSSQ